jgi:hypothetical protein
MASGSNPLRSTRKSGARKASDRVIRIERSAPARPCVAWLPCDDLSTPTYNRAVTLVGMARDILTNIAKGKQATVSYQQEKVTIVKNGQSAPGAAIVLNSTTGLIGMPTQTIQGIFARCLINPAIHCHSIVKINRADIQGGTTPINVTGTNELGNQFLAPIAADGLYLVYRADIYGDTRGNEWYQDLRTVALNTPANAGQTDAIVYLVAN